MAFQSPVVTNVSNFPGTELQGKIDPSKLSLVMDLLIRNYSKPHTATLREWVSNAHDSHVEAGVTAPVKVTLPTSMNPVLEVEDFGVGMSFDDVNNTYLSFLSSTKGSEEGGSDDVIGGFGIGGKSALALADQYTMIAVKDGLKNIFILERSGAERGLGVKPVLVNEPTDQGNGVKVSVALSSNYLNKKEVNSVLRGWKPNEVEITNGSFESIYENWIEFKHGFVSRSRLEDTTPTYGSYYGRNSVIVGSVAYDNFNSIFIGTEDWDISDSKLEEITNMAEALNSELVVKVPVRSVTFPSSRESIEPTEKNTKLIRGAMEGLIEEIKAYQKEKLSSISSYKEAYEASRLHFNRTTKIEIIYDGINFSKLKFEGNLALNFSRRSFGNSILKARKPKEGEETFKMEPGEVMLTIEATAEELALTDETIRKHVRTYLTRNELDFTFDKSVLFVKELTPLHEITSKVIKFSELRKQNTEALKANSTPKKRVKVDWKDRADSLNILYDRVEGTRSFFRRVKLSAYIAEHGVPEYLMATHSPEARTVVELFKAATSLEGAIVYTETKRDYDSILKGYPEIKTLDSFVKELGKEKLAEISAKITNVARLKRDAYLTDAAFNFIKNAARENKLTKETLSIFENETLVLASKLNHFAPMRTYGKKLNKEITWLFSVFGEESFAPLFGRRKGPLSLIKWYSTDAEETIEYLNWSAKRYLAANS